MLARICNPCLSDLYSPQVELVIRQLTDTCSIKFLNQNSPGEPKSPGELYWGPL